jgi:Ca2+-transporting ATPase
VLAVASQRVTASDALDSAGRVIDPERWTNDLTIEMLAGIVDPPRPEARDAIALCRRAGVGVKMITGDHAATAAAIAGELGIEGRVITGAELDAMTDAQLDAGIDAIGVCARVSPEHKVRLVRALKRNGHIVAMTGDGVNDAAALRHADIGVAMGITGTEVTKEAADMVLADDNFATIVGAVEQGRAIYDNIVKFVRFQLTTNLGAIGTLLGASVLGFPAPLSAIQVLYINIIADGPPAMTLGVDPPAKGTMRRGPHRPGTPILDRPRILRLLGAATVMTIGTLGLFVFARGRWGEPVALTMAFTTFVLFQLANVFNARTENASVWSRESLTNIKLWVAVGTVAVCQILIVTTGPLQDLFGTTALTAGQWLLAVLVALAVVVTEEARKALDRKRSRARERDAPRRTTHVTALEPGGSSSCVDRLRLHAAARP